MVISVSAFADDPIKKELVALDKVREVALDIAYRVPGYREASRDCRNWLYDAIRDRVLAAQEAAGAAF